MASSAKATTRVLVYPTPGAAENLSEQQLLQLMYSLFAHIYLPGQVEGNTDYLTLAAANTWQRLYNDAKPSPRPIYAAIVQNLSLDPLTLSFPSTNEPAGPPSTATGQGKVLNPAFAAGQAGGTATYPNIDLETVWIRGPTQGDAFSVEYYE
jgi:hypothetical protein